MRSVLAAAIRRATAGQPAAAPEPEVDPLEVAADELANAKDPKSRAEALRAAYELLNLASKD